MLMQNLETKDHLATDYLSIFPGKERGVWIQLVAEDKWAGRRLN